MNLPLFPLNTVLFPGCVLDLQVFEARYLDMVSACMRRGEGFGVVGIFEGNEVGTAAERYAGYGCEALIRDFQQRPNGLLGIRVEGARRFQIIEAQVQADQLTVAQVRWLDEPRDALLGEEHADLAALLQALGEHPLVAGLDMSMSADTQLELADRLAYLLPFSIEQKVGILGEGSALGRLERIQALLDELQGDMT
ncbi:LON peptidase substrate-binding domain-containing protein [Pseudomonas sp. LRF_L74]|uniref:LON peptidase substrate-binding domain-containing protein n=1 Tax=Pseudomonas sp. LRF_L74 TaxID=3369422 RepID=UPI003F5EF49E